MGKLSPSLVGIRGAAGCGLSEPAQEQGRALALRIQAHSCRGDPDRGRGGSSGCTPASGAGSVGTFHVRAARMQKFLQTTKKESPPRVFRKKPFS